MSSLLKEWNPTTLEDRNDAPLEWKGVSRVIVKSDVFRNDVSETEILSVFTSMSVARNHFFYVKTINTERMRKTIEKWKSLGLTLREGYGAVLPNVCLGTCVRDKKEADERIPALMRTDASGWFLEVKHEGSKRKVFLTKLPSGEKPEVLDNLPFPDWLVESLKPFFKTRIVRWGEQWPKK